MYIEVTTEELLILKKILQRAEQNNIETKKMSKKEMDLKKYKNILETHLPGISQYIPQLKDI